jgi:hypothetical protein
MQVADLACADIDSAVALGADAVPAGRTLQVGILNLQNTRTFNTRL